MLVKMASRGQFAPQDQLFLDRSGISEVGSEHLDTHILAGLCDNLVN